MILIFYLFTVLAYFLTIRSILVKGIEFDIDHFFEFIIIILSGFMPFLNVFMTLLLIWESKLYIFPITNGDQILRKILFVKDKRDKNEIKRKGHSKTFKR